MTRKFLGLAPSDKSPMIGAVMMQEQDGKVAVIETCNSADWMPFAQRYLATYPDTEIFTASRGDEQSGIEMVLRSKYIAHQSCGAVSGMPSADAVIGWRSMDQRDRNRNQNAVMAVLRGLGQ